jgi:hypothetical protein
VNDIPAKQNQETQLRRLAAQRQIYTLAKQILGIQVIITGPIAILLAFGALLIPGLKLYAGCLGIVMSLADLIWITPWLKRLRTRAATIQEAFDCDVLSLPWNTIKVGKRLEPETEKHYADAYEKARASMPPLENWYPIEAGVLPLHVGRLVCQRSNCWWDAKQRRRYAAAVLCFTIGMLIALLVLGMVENLHLQDFFSKVLIPLSPALLLGVRQFVENMDAAARADKLREVSEQLWQDTLSGSSGNEIESRSRALQDEIFEHRKRNPPVADLVFRRLRSKLEAEMNHGADELVRQARQRLNIG